MQELDDKIITLAGTGDKVVFRSIVLHYGKMIKCLALRFTPNQESAEDITQETFIKAYKAIGKYQSQAKFSTWLYRIASNAAIDYLRKNSRHKHNDSLDEKVQLINIQNQQVALDEKLDMGRQIHKALMDLSDVERLAFTLKHHQGYSIQETAKVLKINNNACKQTIYRAVQKLRNQLSPMVST